MYEPLIHQTFAFIVVLFGVLVAFTSSWSAFDANAPKEENVNQRPLLEQQQIPRGRILADDGTVGYSFVRYGQSEFELSHNSELIGEESEFGSILDELTGQKQEGEQIVTNLDPKPQEVAMQDLESAGFGAVVAIEPSTGEVKVLASNPPYDPNSIPRHLSKLNLENVTTPLVNRATYGRYPPGSTFKVVAAAAGLESGVISPETTINAPGSIIDEGHPLDNDGLIDWGPGALAAEAKLPGCWS